jgi:hypothetical protein
VDRIHIAQCAVISWARGDGKLTHGNTWKYPGLKLLHAIPRNQAISVYKRARIVREGYLPDLPHLFLPVAHGKYHGCYLEFKHEDSEISEQQAIMVEWLMEQGYFVEICNNANAAIGVLMDYLETMVLHEQKKGDL